MFLEGKDGDSHNFQDFLAIKVAFDEVLLNTVRRDGRHKELALFRLHLLDLFEKGCNIIRGREDFAAKNQVDLEEFLKGLRNKVLEVAAEVDAGIIHNITRLDALDARVEESLSIVVVAQINVAFGLSR